MDGTPLMSSNGTPVMETGGTPRMGAANDPCCCQICSTLPYQIAAKLYGLSVCCGAIGGYNYYALCEGDLNGRAVLTYAGGSAWAGTYGSFTVGLYTGNYLNYCNTRVSSFTGHVNVVVLCQGASPNFNLYIHAIIDPSVSPNPGIFSANTPPTQAIGVANLLTTCAPAGTGITGKGGYVDIDSNPLP